MKRLGFGVTALLLFACASVEPVKFEQPAVAPQSFSPITGWGEFLLGMTYDEVKAELHKTAHTIVKLSSKPTDPFALRPGSGYLDLSVSGSAEVIVPGFLIDPAVPLESRLLNLSFSPAQFLEAVTLTFRATQATRTFSPLAYAHTVIAPTLNARYRRATGYRYEGEEIAATWDDDQGKQITLLGVDLPGSSDIVILIYSTKAFAASNPTGPRY